MAGQLQVITGIATTVIALIAGLSLNFERLGERVASITRMTATTLAVAMGVLLAIAWVGWPLLGAAPETVGLQRLAMASLLVLMVVSFSPTMTAAVTAETGARGRLSEVVLAMVILADLALLVLFSVVLQLARAAFDTDVSDVNVVARFAWEVGGAVAFGALVGALFALYVRYVGREVTLGLIVVCALLSQVGTTQQFEPLLAAVTAGLVIENLAVAQGEALKAAVQRAAPPVLVIFFVAVGASLQVGTLATLGPLVLVVAALRIAVIRLGLAVGLRGSGIDGATAAYVWTGLISQAGITLGLASIVAVEFPGWGMQLQTLLVALIALHEIIGPVIFRFGLARAGDLESAAARPLLVVSNREPYLHTWNGHGGITARAATGGVAVALDALMRERGGTWIAHGAGDADREVVDAHDTVMVPPDSPTYDAAAAVDRGADVLGLLRRLRQRRSLAALPRRRRPAAVPGRRLGGIPGGQRAIRRGHRPRAGLVQDADLPPGLPSRAGGAGAARAPRRRPHRALLAHSVAVSRSAAHLSVAARDAGRAAGQRPARVPGRTRPTQLPARRGGGARRRDRERGVARPVQRPVDAPSCRCRSASTTTASSAIAADPGLADEQQRLASAVLV